MSRFVRSSAIVVRCYLETLPDGRVRTSWGETRGHRTHPPPVHHRKALREDAQARGRRTRQCWPRVSTGISHPFTAKGAWSVRDDREPMGHVVGIVYVHWRDGKTPRGGGKGCTWLHSRCSECTRMHFTYYLCKIR